MPDRGWRGFLPCGCVSLIIGSRRGGGTGCCGLVGQLDHPACLLARVILLEAGALKTTGEAIVDTGDLELFFRNAHVDPAFPPSSAFRIFCKKIVIAG